MGMNQTIEELAMAKAQIHAQKHVHSMVMGLMVAGKGTTKVVDVLGFCHSCPTGPLVELFMHQVDMLLAQRKQVIAGVYFANELSTDHTLNVYAKLLASRICDHEAQEDGRSLFIYRLGGEMYQLSGAKNSWVKSTHTFKLPVERKESRSFHDFEDHLENVSCDWR